MKLQQLRYISEVARHGLNISVAAENLYTSQPGISKQIRQLEDELGLRIFERKGKHLSEITPAGRSILEIASKILEEVENIKSVSKDFNDSNAGTLSIATTHTQARYILPSIVEKFVERYPKVSLRIHQGTPPQIAELVSSRSVDFGIATEDAGLFGDLLSLPCFRWNPLVVVPHGHPLSKVSSPNLHDVASYPIITYLLGFNSRSKLDTAFSDNGLKPNVVLDAVDTDVIKTYVRLGFGVGIIASPAFNPAEDGDLVALEGIEIFPGAVTEIILRPGTFLRGYMHDFIEEFAPHLSRDLVADLVLNDGGVPSSSALTENDIPSY